MDNINSMDSRSVDENFVKEVNEKQKFSFLAFLQKIGKSLVFPIAVMPAAALFLRIGSAIADSGNVDGNTWETIVYWLGWILQTPGAIVINNLPIMFGLGVSFGLAKDHRGEAALVGVIGYLGIIALVQNEGSLTSLIYENAMTTTILNPDTGQYETYSQVLYLVTTWTDPLSGEVYGHAAWLMNLGVFGGIGAGMLAAFLYNKFSDIQLPKALGFFSGRRFVPIVMLGTVVFVSFILAVIWPWFQYGLVLLAQGLLFSPSLGAGLYAFANRLLIPTGLHQVLNVFLWFQMPILVDGAQVFILNSSTGVFEPMMGDINAFLSTNSSMEILVNGTAYSGSLAFEQLQSANVGAFQTGFFPIMMFGLPAVGLAIAFNADDENKKATFALMSSTAAVSFITGITEPLEFSFMFISPMLYFAYAILSGVVAALTVATGASIGFGFSAGAIDFGLSAQISSELSQGMSSYAGGYGGLINVMAIGIISFPIYFFMTHFMIRGLNLSTPGRNGNMAGLDSTTNSETSLSKNRDEKLFNMAINTIALTGKENLRDIDNCITRVRLTVKDNTHISQEDAVNAGYTGMFKPGKNAIQFVIGPESEKIANYMKDIISNYDKYKIHFEDKEVKEEPKSKIENYKNTEVDQNEVIKRIIKSDLFYKHKTVREIKEILDENNIKYKSTDRKDDLRKLLKKIK